MPFISENDFLTTVTMSENPLIVCKVTNWFLWRALLMLVMFGGFCVFFLYDWKYGYPEKNVIVANYRAFAKAGQAWTIKENQDRWPEYVSEQKIPWGDDLSIYPQKTDFEQAWPAILADQGAMDDKSDEGLWKEYAKKNRWDQQIDLDEDPKPAYKIREQLYAAYVCGTLTLVALFFYLRTKRRNMVVDNEAYTSPNGVRIPYEKMTTIDKRKWETKGLATITYTDKNGQPAKVKVDGMVYGQFKEEDGAPAEALFQRVLANFEGELIELVSVDEEEEEGHEANQSEESDKSEFRQELDVSNEKEKQRDSSDD